MSYPGQRGARTYRSKYVGCEHRKVRGVPVRLLTAAEIAEFHAHVESCIDKRGQLRRAAR